MRTHVCVVNHSLDISILPNTSPITSQSNPPNTLGLLHHQQSTF